MRILLFLAVLAFSLPVSAQKAYTLKFRVEGWKDTTAYLGHYYGESTYLRDTARVNSRGEFVFDGKKPLDLGVYFVVLNKQKIFEIVVGKTQNVTFETRSDDYVKNMKVTGDPDNTLFFQNMIYNMERHLEAEPFLKILQDSLASKESQEAARTAFQKINEKVIDFQKKLVAANPGLVTAAIVKSAIPVEIPEPPKRPNGTIDSTWQLKWYREHFFDHFDLANDALIRMPRPVYQEKVLEYLDKLFVPNPDSVFNAIRKLATKVEANKETYKYLVWVCMIKYQQPEIMGLDGVYVKLYDEYYASGKMNFWVSDKLKKNLKDFADRTRKSLLGNKAPDLIMQDLNLQKRSMYAINKRYTLLFIFDPDCGHCREETPKLVKFYTKNKTRLDLEVFAVSTDTSMAKMRDFMKEMKTEWITVNGPRTYVGSYQDLYDAITTPSLFIIDRQKKIIGKKIPVDDLENFFQMYERVNPPVPNKGTKSNP